MVYEITILILRAELDTIYVFGDMYFMPHELVGVLMIERLWRARLAAAPTM